MRVVGFFDLPVNGLFLVAKREPFDGDFVARADRADGDVTRDPGFADGFCGFVRFFKATARV